VRPSTQPNAVDVIALENGVAGAPRTLIADGRPHHVELDGCQGRQTITFADSGARVYVASDYTCGELHGASTTLLAISPSGEWLESENVRAGGGAVSSSVRYRDVGLSSAPKALRDALAGRQLAITTARAAASSPPKDADVADALGQVDTVVVREWLAERGRGEDGRFASLVGRAEVAAVPVATAAPVAMYAPYVERVVIQEVEQPAPAPAPVYSGRQAVCSTFTCYTSSATSVYGVPAVYPFVVAYPPGGIRIVPPRPQVTPARRPTTPVTPARVTTTKPIVVRGPPW
jgi:hypothetical protein